MAGPGHHMRPGHGVVCGDDLCFLGMCIYVAVADRRRGCLRGLCALAVEVRGHPCGYFFGMGCGSVVLGYLCRNFGGRLAGGIDCSLRLVFAVGDRDLVNLRASVGPGGRRVNRPLL